MLASDQSWLTSAIYFGIALLVGACLYWATRYSVQKSSIKRLVFSCITCLTIIGLGFVLQPLIWEIFIFPPSNPSSLYVVEYQPGRAFSNLLLIWLSGCIPGIALGVILDRTKLGSNLVTTCVSTMLVLLVYDLIQPVITIGILRQGTEILRQANIIATLNNLGYSLASDVIGGALAGIICRTIILSICHPLASSVDSARAAAGRRLLFGAVGAATFFVLGYLIFLHPLPIEVTLDVDAYSQRTFVVAKNPPLLGAIFSPQPGSVFEKAFSNAAIHFPVRNLDVLTLGLLPNTKPSSELPNAAGLAIWLKGNGNQSPIKATLFGTVGCDTSDKAFNLTQYLSTSKIPIDLNNAEMKLSGFTQELRAYDDDDAVQATFWVPKGQILVESKIDVPGQSDNNVSLGALGGTIDIPAKAGLRLVLGSYPNVFPLIAKGQISQHVSNALPVSLSLTGNAPDKIFTLPRGLHGDTSCQALPELQGQYANEIKDGDSFGFGRFVISVDEGLPQATLSYSTGLSGVVFKSFDDLPSLSGIPASFISAVVNAGKIKLGDQYMDLRDGDEIQFAAENITVDDKKGGSFSAKAKSRYILIGGNLVSKSIWAAMDATSRFGIESTFVAAIAWILRRHWDAILNALKNWW